MLRSAAAINVISSTGTSAYDLDVRSSTTTMITAAIAVTTCISLSRLAESSLATEVE